MHTNVEFVHGGGGDKNNGKKQAGGKFLKKYDGFETGWKVNFSQFSIRCDFMDSLHYLKAVIGGLTHVRLTLPHGGEMMLGVIHKCF